MGAGKTYGVRGFAQIAGVTVRALHHYDALGLLKPRRTASGYRRYRESDLERLEQIIALRFIGVPLKSIRALLDGTPNELIRALRLQRSLLEEKRRRLNAALAAVADAETALRRGEEADIRLLRRIIEVIEMQSNSDWLSKYFRDDAKTALEARKAAWTPELQAHAEQDWSALFGEIRMALDEDPASPKAQALVDRWNDLLRAFLGGDTQLVHGVKALYADRANWPAGFKTKMAPFSDERVWEFVIKAAAARRSQTE
ncbi:MAG TPA: MerR family transcriptional regulator [Bryobacteraceae bacterium]|nr:MerR family transcriptional regulator [Bryobacteraceae bacterium]